jgi:hypothetical protein
VNGEVHDGHASGGSGSGASRFLTGPVTYIATHGGIPVVGRAASRRLVLGGIPTSSVKRLLKVPSDEQPTRPCVFRTASAAIGSSSKVSTPDSTSPLVEERARSPTGRRLLQAQVGQHPPAWLGPSRSWRDPDVHRLQPRRPRPYFLDLCRRPIGVRHGPSPSWRSALPAHPGRRAGTLPQDKCGWSIEQACMQDVRDPMNVASRSATASTALSRGMGRKEGQAPQATRRDQGCIQRLQHHLPGTGARVR